MPKKDHMRQAEVPEEAGAPAEPPQATAAEAVAPENTEAPKEAPAETSEAVAGEEVENGEDKVIRLSAEQQREVEYGIPAGARLCLSEFEHPYSREVYETDDVFFWLLRQKREVVGSGSVKKKDDPVAARTRVSNDLAKAVKALSAV